MIRRSFDEIIIHFNAPFIKFFVKLQIKLYFIPLKRKNQLKIKNSRELNKKLLRGDARRAQSAIRHAPSPWSPKAKICRCRLFLIK
jgi:hypothetical protein